MMRREKITKYIELVVPTWPCNFRCHYCYVGQHLDDKQRAKVDIFQFSPIELRNALSISRLGGVAIVNFCAHGETLILKTNLEYIKAILEAGHYVMVVTNMTQTRAITELLSLPQEQIDRLFFKCSFHWLELKRLGYLDLFVENVNKAWLAGASVTVEITPSDELESYIDEIKAFSMAHFGALPHITVPRDENHDYGILSGHSLEDFKRIWGSFDSDLFDYKMSIWGISMRDKVCYAGDGAYSINMATGEIFRCSSRCSIGNLFKGKRLPVDPALNQCPFEHCYNGHFWLAFGLVPGFARTTYAAMRDRVRNDGEHWVKPRMLKAFHSIWEDHQKAYSPCKFYFARRRQRKNRHSFWWHLRHLKF